MWCLFKEFLRLGLIAFGGPIAHIAWFQRRFVQELAWLDQSRFAELLALCQLLPGPTSSQLGMAIGHHRAGWPGAITAFIAFTLPSATLMVAAGLGLPWLLGWSQASAVMTSLGLFAVLIVGQALLSMTKSLLATPGSRLLCLVVLAVLLVRGQSWQLPLLALSSLLGALFFKPQLPASPLKKALTWQLPVALSGVVVLVLVPFGPLGELARTGALVFGGGHVVLPLLAGTQLVQQGLEPSHFLAGYGLAQVMPGPLFSFAAFLGSASTLGPGGLMGGLWALGAIYLPSFLLLWGILPCWQQLRQWSWLQGALRGANGAVVALLAHTWYQELWLGSVTSNENAALLVLGAALLLARVPVVVLALLAVLSGLILY